MLNAEKVGRQNRAKVQNSKSFQVHRVLNIQEYKTIKRPTALWHSADLAESTDGVTMNGKFAS